jgi:hypothetical protein
MIVNNFTHFCGDVWAFLVEGFLLFADIYIAVGDPVLIKRGGFLLTGLTLSHICACPMLGPITKMNDNLT